jgi:hypothetical protein
VTGTWQRNFLSVVAEAARQPRSFGCPWWVDRYFGVAVALLTDCSVTGVEIVAERCTLGTEIARCLLIWLRRGINKTPHCASPSCRSTRADALRLLSRALSTAQGRAAMSAYGGEASPNPAVGRRTAVVGDCSKMFACDDDVTSSELEDVFGPSCVCSLLHSLHGLRRLCNHDVQLRTGNALLTSDLSDDEVSSADIIFCNNYRGCASPSLQLCFCVHAGLLMTCVCALVCCRFWAVDKVVTPSGECTTFQAAVRARLLDSMKPGTLPSTSIVCVRLLPFLLLRASFS